MLQNDTVDAEKWTLLSQLNM